MRAARQVGWAWVGVVAWAGAAIAQVPGVPPAAAGAGAVPAAAAPAATAAAGAAPKNIWAFFMKTPEQKAQCKAHFCNSKIGQFVNNLLLPASAMSGGLIGPCCPGPLQPNPEDLKKPASSALGAAAKIKAEEAQAKAKIEALEYLGTVDCRYYPEAEAALVNGLRAEKNECVRLAAAKALAAGCCCTAKIVKALTMSVNCSDKDGFPAEASELVRTFAFVALERCMQKCVPADPETPPEQPPAVKQALYDALKPVGAEWSYSHELVLAAYYTPVIGETKAKVFADARLVLAKGLKISPATVARLSGPKNVYDSVTSVRTLADSGPTTATTAPAAKTVAAGEPALAPRPGGVTPAEFIPPPPSGANPAYFPDAAPQPEPAPRKGRANLFNIFQDARRR